MEPPQIPSDADIREAAMAYADIIFDPIIKVKLSSTKDERIKTVFIEDFEMGAKWMRNKIREAYEDIPTQQGREGEPKASQTT